jgi:SAM-dependent methyltransferase
VPETWTTADAYEQYIGRWSRLLAPTFLTWANIPRRAEALDVGCGTGALSEALLAHGVTSLTAIDQSEPYVEAARKKLATAKTATRFDVGDATKLPYPKGRFDIVVSGLVLNFVPQPLEMAREMLRVLRPGGRGALYVWDYAGRMEPIRHFWDAAVAQNPLRAGRLDEGKKFPVCNPQKLEEIFRLVGFKEIKTDHIDQPTPFRSFDDYWNPFLGGQGPAPSYLLSLSPNEQADLRERVRKRLHIAADGKILMTARAFAVQGKA